MERARVLKQRIEQQVERERLAANETLHRTTARLVRPLIEQQLLHFASVMGGTIQTATEIPSHKLENDRYSVIFSQPVRDYLTTKAFTLSNMDTLFVLYITYQQVRFDLIGRRYRYRGRFEGVGDAGVWLPPGDYTETMALAEVRWNDDGVASGAINSLFATVETQIPAIHLFANSGSHNARNRRHLTFRRKAVIWTATAIYLATMIAVLAWCVVTMFLFLRFGPNFGVSP